MMSNRTEASQLAKFGVIILIGILVGFTIFSQLASKDLDNNNELKAEPSMMKAGGLGNIREKNDEIVDIVKQIKSEFEVRSEKKFQSIEVLSYRAQTVAGRNYFVKARAKELDGPEMIVHLRIYQDLGNNLELTAYELDKKEEDELHYFQ